MKKFTFALLFLLGTLALAQVGPSGVVNPQPIVPPNYVYPTQTLTTAGNVVLTLSGVNSCTIRERGTHSAMSLNVQVSNNGGTSYTTTNLFPIPNGGPAITAAGATGFWSFNASQINRVKLLLNSITGTSAIIDVTCSAVTSTVYRTTNYVSDVTGATIAGVKAASTVPAPTDPSLVVAISPNGQFDPCGNPAVAKSSAAINISTATTAAIVAAVASQVIYPCAVILNYTSGTAPTVVFKSGTQVTTACDTGTVTYSGTMAVPATAGLGLVFGNGYGMFTPTVAAGQFCITSGGTSPVLQGWLVYVQQPPQ